MESHITEHINILIQMAKIDGHFDIKEKAFIYNVCLRKGIPLDDIGDLIDYPQPLSDSVDLPKETANEYLKDCLLVMMVDGKILPTEIKFCTEIGERLGFDPTEIKNLIEKLQESDSISDELLNDYVSKLGGGNIH